MADWNTDIQAAMDASIDAFALNIANDVKIGTILPNFFTVAAEKNIQLFLSYDHAGNGPFTKADVIGLLHVQTYTALDAYSSATSMRAGPVSRLSRDQTTP